MSATMARQEGRAQLEQSDMRFSSNMAKMANQRFSCAAIEETQQGIKKPRAQVREDIRWGVELPVHQKVNAAIERHPAMVYNNPTDCRLPSQNGTANNPQTRWRCNGTAAPPPEPAAPPPGTPPAPGTLGAPQGDIDGQESYEINVMPCFCVYIDSSHPNTPFFDHNGYAKASKRDEDFIPDLRSTLSAMWK